MFPQLWAEQQRNGWFEPRTARGCSTSPHTDCSSREATSQESEHEEAHLSEVCLGIRLKTEKECSSGVSGVMVLE